MDCLRVVSTDVEPTKSDAEYESEQYAVWSSMRPWMQRRFGSFDPETADKLQSYETKLLDSIQEIATEIFDDKETAKIISSFLQFTSIIPNKTRRDPSAPHWSQKGNIGTVHVLLN